MGKMKTFMRTGNRAIRLAAAVSTIALLSACAVTPEPFTQAEFNAQAAADRAAMFKGQEALSGPLTLEEALARVLKYNLDRRAKMMEEALALGQLDLDRFDLLPKLAANAAFTARSEPNATVSRDLINQTTSTGNPTYSTDRDTLTADLGLTWNLLDFGVSYFTAHQNADRALIASERRRRTVQNLAQEVRFTFWRAAAAQALKDKVAATVATAERALKDAEKVEAERLRDPVDSLRVQKTLLESIRQLEAIDQELTTAKAELAALINLPPGTDFRLDTSRAMEVPVIDLGVERMEELALANNPDLREQDYLGRITVDETRKEIVKLLPGVTFSASRQYDSNSFLLANRWSEAGARLSWNLINLISAPDRIDHAETAEKVAEAKRLALRMAVLAQVHVVSTQFDSAAKQFQRADRLWTIETRLAQASANQSQGGTQSEIEKVTQDTSAIAAELRRYQTYAQLQSAFGKLRATIGSDPLPQAVAAHSIEAISQGIRAVDEKAQPEVAEPASPEIAEPAPAQVSALAAPPAQPDGQPEAVEQVVAQVKALSGASGPAPSTGLEAFRSWLALAGTAAN
jgi:outer membrane protein TolC